MELPEGVAQYTAPAELFEYASPLKSSGGPVFTVKMPKQECDIKLERAIVLENLQDPGNVGTVIRTANAFNIDAVILVGACADLYNPKTVRASMGAIFRQRVLTMSIQELDELTQQRSAIKQPTCAMLKFTGQRLQLAAKAEDFQRSFCQFAAAR